MGVLVEAELVERRALVDERGRVLTAYARLREAQRNEPFPSCERRLEQLGRLGAAIRARSSALVAAADADFGGRSANTTKIGDLSVLLRELDHIRRRLRRWMAPEPRGLALHYRPARGQVEPQPLGVVGVIAPWNYPFRLALGPLVAALAAGNRVLLKPSELTPRCSALLASLLSEALEPGVVDVVTGGPAAAQTLAELPLDHLFFTGSTEVGRALFRIAAERLTPMTLELGGKCPVVVHPTAPLGYAARRIVAGKLFNAGQTCMAPDHLFLHESQLEAGVQALCAEITRQYPSAATNPEYTAIINERHRTRLRRLLADAGAHGAELRTITHSSEGPDDFQNKLPPTLILRPSLDMEIAREEIFGPVLPIWTYRRIEEVTERLRASPSPLALYYFDADRPRCRAFLQATRSGGSSINDVILHALQDDLPFGGVGASGMGRYHGRDGFETFSNRRAVFYQTRRNWAELLIPPYGRLAHRMIDWLSR